jgi:hypothetical protein
VDTGGSFPRVKALFHEADHSPPSGAEVKNDVAIPPYPHSSLCHGAQLINHRDDFTSTCMNTLIVSNILMGLRCSVGSKARILI